MSQTVPAVSPMLPASFVAITRLVLGVIALMSLPSCAEEATPMPTVAAVAEAVDRDAQPALYQLLYDAPVLPSSRPEQQRVRILVWLRHMDFGEGQLQQLDELRKLVRDRSEQIVTAERQIEATYQAEEDEIYQGLWDRLAAGAPGDAPEVAALTDRLAVLQKGSDRERALLTARIEGIRAVMDAEAPFLATLSPRQEALLADALFFLRNHLDPVGNPGDFRVLVGTTYEPGQYAVLTRGTSRWARQPLNIGGLWSDEPPLAGGSLHEARREVLLFLALMEPGMADAIAAARALLAQELDLGLGDVPEEDSVGEGSVGEGSVEEGSVEEGSVEEGSVGDPGPAPDAEPVRRPEPIPGVAPPGG